MTLFSFLQYSRTNLLSYFASEHSFLCIQFEELQENRSIMGLNFSFNDEREEEVEGHMISNFTDISLKSILTIQYYFHFSK